MTDLIVTLRITITDEDVDHAVQCLLGRGAPEAFRSAMAHILAFCLSQVYRVAVLGVEEE
jgi:hypothetical protein